MLNRRNYALSIRQVKKEVRALGVAIKKKSMGGAFNIVGVVFRGNSLIDGVMMTEAKCSDLTSEVAQMILSSRHYEQIRVIILEHPMTDGSASIDSLRLAQSVSKPVLILTLGLTPQLRDEVINHLQIEKNKRIFSVASIGIKSRTAEKVIKMASRLDEALPECLRVSNLILDSLTCFE